MTCSSVAAKPCELTATFTIRCEDHRSFTADYSVLKTNLAYFECMDHFGSIEARSNSLTLSPENYKQLETLHSYISIPDEERLAWLEKQPITCIKTLRLAADYFLESTLPEIFEDTIELYFKHHPKIAEVYKDASFNMYPLNIIKHLFIYFSNSNQKASTLVKTIGLPTEEVAIFGRKLNDIGILTECIKRNVKDAGIEYIKGSAKYYLKNIHSRERYFPDENSDSTNTEIKRQKTFCERKPIEHKHARLYFSISSVKSSTDIASVLKRYPQVPVGFILDLQPAIECGSSPAISSSLTTSVHLVYLNFSRESKESPLLNDPELLVGFLKKFKNLKVIALNANSSPLLKSDKVRQIITSKKIQLWDGVTGKTGQTREGAINCIDGFLIKRPIVITH